MTLEGKKIGFGITASFCTILKILEPMRRLKELGADIYPVISDNISRRSSRFHERDAFLDSILEIAGREPIATTAGAETLGPGKPLDALVIAPATGTTIARLANGISDGPVLMAAKATLRNNRPVILALFTNDALSANGVNIMRLYNTKNVYFVPFGQDDPDNKPASMTANLSFLEESLMCALDGRQIQPSLITL